MGFRNEKKITKNNKTTILLQRHSLWGALNFLNATAKISVAFSGGYFKVTHFGELCIPS